MKIAAQSTEYVQVLVQNTEGINPTSDAVFFAYLQSGSSNTSGVTSPTPATPIYPGSWTTVNGQYIALGLVGPVNGGTVLAPGQYTVWVKITDNPEVPFKPAGGLTIY